MDANRGEHRRESVGKLDAGATGVQVGAYRENPLDPSLQRAGDNAVDVG